MYDVVVDLTDERILRCNEPKGVYLGTTMEDFAIVEGIVRVHPQVVEQCSIVEIPPEDMHKVSAIWTLVQGLMY